MRHLDEGTIHAWLDGALDPVAERKAEDHAARCTECAVAVADARGLIAASSRILTALDDVPAGVLPQGSRAAPGMRRMARIAQQPAPRRWPTWPVRIAASIVVVATGTIVVVNSGVNRVASLSPEKAERQLPPGVTLQVTPAIMPDTASQRATQASMPAAAAPLGNEQALAEADKKGKGEPKTLGDTNAPQRFATGGEAATPAAPPAKQAASNLAASNFAAAPAEARAEVRAEPDSTSARELVAGVASKAPKMKLDAAAPASSGARTADMARAVLPPGIRLVSEERATEDSRLVQRRVYEVRPGLEVMLAILAPAAQADGRVDALEKDPADSVKRTAFHSRAISIEAPGVNSIQWTDSTGFEFTLSGPLPLDSLRALRGRLPRQTQRQ